MPEFLQGNFTAKALGMRRKPNWLRIWAVLIFSCDFTNTCPPIETQLGLPGLFGGTSRLSAFPRFGNAELYRVFYLGWIHFEDNLPCYTCLKYNGAGSCLMNLQTLEQIWFSIYPKIVEKPHF
jgi:hypothetical protein